MFQYLRRQNVSVPPDQNISQGVTCFNTPRPKYAPGGGGKTFQYPYTVSYYLVLKDFHLNLAVLFYFH